MKTISVYYSAAPVASLTELKMPDNVEKWHKCAALHLEPGRPIAQADLLIPLLTANLMFEYAEFHDDARRYRKYSHLLSVHTYRMFSWFDIFSQSP